MGDDELAKVIGLNVRATREAAGLTQAQLSNRTGIAVPHLSRLESGSHPPNLKTVNKVANALDVTAADLLNSATASVKPSESPSETEKPAPKKPKK